MNINLSRAKDDKGNLCFVMIDDNEEVSGLNIYQRMMYFRKW